MKKTICLMICLLMAVVALAQTQQGIVKTRGRMVNGQLVPGKGLPGASVTIKGGNAVVSSSTGTFSLAIHGNNFYLQNVQKKGYELVDADVTKRHYQYSDNPLYLLMETPEQQMEDLLDAQEKISKTLREQLKKARAEIQRLKDEQKISEEEYNQRIAQMMQNQLGNQKFIADMAKEYAQMDYDQMDELNRQISDAILNGELTKADSLLRSKGDIHKRIAKVDIIKKNNKVQREELEANEASVKNAIEDIAKDCYNRASVLSLSRIGQMDSAIYYYTMAADLDTTSISMQVVASMRIAELSLNDYSIAKRIRLRVLAYVLSFDNNFCDRYWAYHLVGEIYDCEHNYRKALECYTEKLKYAILTFGENSEEVVDAYELIASDLEKLGEYGQALNYLNKVASILPSLPDVSEEDWALLFKRQAEILYASEDYPQALSLYKKALALFEKTETMYCISESLFNVAECYEKIADYAEALNYYHKSLLKWKWIEEHKNEKYPGMIQKINDKILVMKEKLK